MKSLFFLAFLWTPLWCQVTTGIIAGVVVDPNNRPIAQAEVMVKDQARSLARSVKTNERGFYRVGELPPALYTV
ncbi:MAG: carboxypeptidase-like regulatory domain-containing protein, partial [Bryobacteraceae bacterium]